MFRSYRNCRSGYEYRLSHGGAIQTILESVANVISKRHPFKIFSTVVKRISVNVIYRHTRCISETPCQADKPRNKPGLFHTILPQNHPCIGSTLCVSYALLLYNPLFPVANAVALCICRFSFASSDIAEVRCLIKPFISGNISPEFH